jgi:N-acetylglucosamine-6-phosphate deacetylase
MSYSLLIKNVLLYKDIESSTCFDILTRDGLIVSISPTGEITEKVDDIIDGSGKTAIPGLIEMHIHGAGGADSLDGTKEALSIISQTLAEHGTTSFLSTMVMKPGLNNRHLKAAGESTGKNLGGAQLLGSYIEGPFINYAKRGGIVAESITGSSGRVLDQIFEETGDALKMMCVAPEIPGIAGIIENLLKNRVKVAFGHSDADYKQTKEGFKMGINHVTHLFNAMRSLHHRDPGPLAAIFENQKISVELIGDSHHVHPALFKMVWSMKGPDKIACITDGISAMGLPEGTYVYNNRQYTSKDGLARYLDGTFIGSTMNLLKIAKNFKSFSGSTFSQAIDTVTINPARILGLDHIKGSLEAGKDADIVLIDASFKVSTTIISGRTIYQTHK